MTGRADHSQKFGFVLGRSVLPHHRGTRAIFHCSKCQARCEVTPPHPLNPEQIAKMARKLGWDADGYRKSTTRCPTCLHRRSPGESPKEPTIMATEPKPTTLPRDPTTGERMKIRALLDQHFDDSAGMYLDGYSDQRIGEESGVPWAIVTKIREAAYGTIRVDPEITALRAEIDQAARKLAALEKSLAAEVQTITGLKARIETAMAKRSAA